MIGVRIALVGLSAGACASAFGILDDHAKDLLVRCMRHTLNVNVRAIVAQRCSDNHQMRQVKVEQTRSGKSRVTIIQPLSEQGIEYVDDGEQMATYFPDTQKVEIARSRRRQERSAKRMVDLAEKNYSLNADHESVVAGRRVILVTAVPKFKGMPSRKFYIDADTAYLLRLEVTDFRGLPVLCFDTLSVTYPKDIEDPVASFPQARNVSVSKRTSEVCSVDFDPIVANELPMGFAVHKTETVCSEGKTLAIRISDGLARGTVYEWKKEPGERVGKDAVYADIGRVRILVAADLPRALKLKILNAFVSTQGPFVERTVPRFSEGGTLTVTSRVQE